MPNYKLVDADKLDADLATLADGIRNKSGKIGPLNFPEGMVEALNTPDNLEGFFDGSTTEIVLPTVKSIKTRAFYNNAQVTKVTAPNVISIKSYAFLDSAIVTLVAPKLEEIGESAFDSAYETQGIQFNSGGSLPNSVKKIGKKAFIYCQKLNLKSLPESLEEVGESAFEHAQVSATSLPPNLRMIHPRAFYCTFNIGFNSLPPKLKYIGSNAFAGNSKAGPIDIIPASVEELDDFPGFKYGSTVTFKGVPNYIGTAALSTEIDTLNVPWPEDYIEDAPWGAEYAEINYDVFDTDETLAGAWQFGRYNEYEDYVKNAYETDDWDYIYEPFDLHLGECGYWRVSIPFTCNGKEYVAMEYDVDYSTLYYIDADGKYTDAYGYVWVEEDEGDWDMWYDESYRDIVVDNSATWKNIYVSDEYEGEILPRILFYNWLTKHATKQ